MNATNLIFQLFHIPTLLTLVVLTPPYLPCTPSIDRAHLFVDCVNSLFDYDNTSVDYTDFFLTMSTNMMIVQIPLMIR